MSFSNPRRTPVTRRAELTSNDGLRLKTNNLTLRKGATFHSPTSPTSQPEASERPVPSLPRRSQTNLEDVVDAHRRRAALKLDQIDLTLASKRGTTTPRSFRDDSLPVSQSLLEHIVVNDTMSRESSPMAGEPERRILRPRHSRSNRHHESDSGLGSSIVSKRSGKPTGGATAITRSVTVIESESITRLSQRAMNRIHEHTLKPLLAKSSLKAFRPIVLDCPRRISEGKIVCLRDLEKTLLFMAPERAKSVELYLDFALTSVRCIQATVEYLSDREQTRPDDRPYSSGYFIDLVEQLRMHARQMQAARERQDSSTDADEMDIDPTDELKLVGGLALNGRPAQLVRVKKNGKTIDASGQTIEDVDEDAKSPIRFKRSMSEQLEDEEEILRSMARRKKNASPAELAPKKCKEPGCNKEFKRPCDLTKHEKTHSRPWKCPHSTCKYHEYGWPTEKEMDRHINDKHSDAPAMYECLYKPCPYKSKRESNCKQHMEKAHGWTYVRTKTNGKKGDSKAGSSAQPTPIMGGMPTPTSDRSNSIAPAVMTPPEDSVMGYPDLTFPSYPSSEEFNASLFEDVPFDGDIQLDYQPLDNGTPSTDSGQFNTYQELSHDVTGQFEDIYGAHVQLPTPTHSIYAKPTDVFTNFMGPVSQAPAQVSHISPVGQGNTMLFTPSSLAEVDEGFDEFPANDQLGNDFLLFPPTGKTVDFDSNLFLPSAAAGFSQPSSQEFNMDYNGTMDWTSTDYNTYHHH